MEEEHQRLNLREEPAKIGVDEERKCYDRIEEKRSMPSLVIVVWVIQD